MVGKTSKLFLLLITNLLSNVTNNWVATSEPSFFNADLGMAADFRLLLLIVLVLLWIVLVFVLVLLRIGKLWIGVLWWWGWSLHWDVDASLVVVVPLIIALVMVAFMALFLVIALIVLGMVRVAALILSDVFLLFAILLDAVQTSWMKEK